jgi:hypothetical protein
MLEDDLAGPRPVVVGRSEARSRHREHLRRGRATRDDEQ